MSAPKGFATLSPERRRAIASLGGKASHAKGTGHEWKKGAEASEMGRKGGLARNGRAPRAAPTPPPVIAPPVVDRRAAFYALVKSAGPPPTSMLAQSTASAPMRPQRTAPVAPSPASKEAGRCHAWHPTHGRCIGSIGHYRDMMDAAPSPHGTADGRTWFGIALRADEAARSSDGAIKATSSK